jgi:hypothetical protein
MHRNNLAGTASHEWRKENTGYTKKFVLVKRIQMLLRQNEINPKLLNQSILLAHKY